MPDSRVHRFEKMPCCCETNVKAALVIGIIFAISSVLLCFGFGFSIDFRYADEALLLLVPILIFLASLLLIFGAYKRNRTAILIWMILATILLIGGFIRLVIFDAYSIIFASILTTFDIFLCWSIYVAKNARNEIEIATDLPQSRGKEY